MEGAALILVGTLVGCSLPAPPSRVLYQQGRMVVQLETDPSAGGMDAAGWNTQPAVLQPAQLATVLRGVRIRSAQGLLGSLLSLSPPSEAVFAEDEAALLATCGLDDNRVAGGAGGSDGVAQVVLDVAAIEAELAGDRRSGARLRRQHPDEIAPERHDACVIRIS